MHLARSSCTAAIVAQTEKKFRQDSIWLSCSVSQQVTCIQPLVRPGMAASSVFGVVVVIAIWQSADCGRTYADADPVKLYANKVGPFSNPR
jgi:hypothetical protein